MIKEDRSGLDRLEAFIKGKSEIRTGILDKGSQTHQDDGFTIARLAEVHEFGLGQVERSFIRAWFDANRERLTREAIEHFKSGYLAGVSPEVLLEQLAVKFAADCQARMVSGWTYPDIEQATKDRKGSSTPLIDTGILKSAITSIVIRS